MKKYADNLMRYLEGISGRLSQLEVYCHNLERSIADYRSDISHSQDEVALKFRSLEKHLQEASSFYQPPQPPQQPQSQPPPQTELPTYAQQQPSLQASQYPQYQQQWHQPPSQLPQQVQPQPPQPQQSPPQAPIRPQTPPIYPSYPHQPPNPLPETFQASMPMQSRYSGAIPYGGYGGPQQLQQQLSMSRQSHPLPPQIAKGGYAGGGGPHTPVMRYGGSMGAYGGVAGSHMGYPYAELAEKAVSMGYGREQVLMAIQRMEESGERVDFNALLDRLNMSGGGVAQRGGWSG
ncbi:hypothetical protein QJS10_CPB12g00970 [Acorus calamus]|uniref:DUF1421 domain-containing protein n=1 Tax=Acorus calamus TaxID=4465 RepID=A0AAV9DJX4_ACOCL|nr:hypothetical protein QJS10_CPB12g00970 [Acorus calamus]